MKKYGNRIVGFTDQCVFNTSKTNLDPSIIKGMLSKKELGEDAVIIAKDKVASMTLVEENQKFIAQIEARGMGDDMGIQCANLQELEELVSSLAKLTGKNPVIEQRKIGVAARMTGTIVLASAASIITYLLHMASVESIAKGVEMAEQASRKTRSFAVIGEALGPTGILAVGGIVILAIIVRGVLKVRVPLPDSTRIRDVKFQ
jgi:hypothetical protein